MSNPQTGWLLNDRYFSLRAVEAGSQDKGSRDSEAAGVLLEHSQPVPVSSREGRAELAGRGLFSKGTNPTGEGSIPTTCSRPDSPYLLIPSHGGII